MATYFISESDEDSCTWCGHCVEAYPVECVEVEGTLSVVNREWFIGGGVCVAQCPSGAAKLKMRRDVNGRVPARTFDELHRRIL